MTAIFFLGACTSNSTFNSTSAPASSSNSAGTTASENGESAPAFNASSIAEEILAKLEEEDWDYLFNHLEHYENDTTNKDDIKYYFEQKTMSKEVGKSIREQGYKIEEIKEENDHLTTFSLSKPKVRIRMGIKNDSLSPDNYKLVLDYDFSTRHQDENAKLQGAPLLISKKAKNPTVRGIKIKPEWKDENLKEVLGQHLPTEYQAKLAEYDIYRVVLPDFRVTELNHELPEDEAIFLEFKEDKDTVRKAIKKVNLNLTAGLDLGSIYFTEDLLEEK